MVTDYKTILLVDDDQDMLKLNAFFLESEGFVPTTIDSGKEAQQILLKNRFDIIIIDLMMPGMDGMTLLKWIRMDACITGPVLVYTAVNKASVERDLMDAGATDILTKPIDPAELKEILERL